MARILLTSSPVGRSGYSTPYKGTFGYLPGCISLTASHCQMSPPLNSHCFRGHPFRRLPPVSESTFANGLRALCSFTTRPGFLSVVSENALIHRVQMNHTFSFTSTTPFKLLLPRSQSAVFSGATCYTHGASWLLDCSLLRHLGLYDARDRSHIQGNRKALSSPSDQGRDRTPGRGAHSLRPGRTRPAHLVSNLQDSRPPWSHT